MGQIFGPLSQRAQFLQGIPNQISPEWWRWLWQVGSLTGVNPPQSGSGTSLSDIELLALTEGNGLFAERTAGGNMSMPSTEPSSNPFDARLLTPAAPDSRTSMDAQLLVSMRLDPPPPSSWRAFSPTVTSGSGSFTAVSATGRYQVVGKTVQVAIEIDVTTVGTAATSVLATLPAACNKTLTSGYQALSGVEFGSTNKALTGLIGYPDSSRVRLVFYDGTFPGASGNKLIVQGSYEAS
jgi:hypothetical protein